MLRTSALYVLCWGMMYLSACSPDNAPASRPPETVWDRARESGVDFRGIGQEPGWYLEIFDGERIVFVTGYGETRVTTPAPEPAALPGGGTSYVIETEAHDLLITILQEPCQDTMSGEAFPATVEVVLDGEAVSGCGRPL